MSVRSVESALDDVIEVLAELGPLHIFAKEPELRYRSDAIAKYGILDAAYRIADGRLPTDRPGLKVLRTLNLVASPSEHARASEVNLLDELARETEEKQLFVKLFLEQREQLTSWPREFVVHDACSTNAPSIWLAKHFYLQRLAQEGYTWSRRSALSPNGMNRIAKRCLQFAKARNRSLAVAFELRHVRLVVIMTREQETRSVWDWLDQVRQRPGMWLGRTDTPVQDLQMLVSGYYAALQTHGIVEEGPAMTHFSTWLRMTTNWSVSCGWAVAIAEHAEGRDALALFFELADRFKLLQPTILSRVTLAEWHRPTGSRTGIGVGGRIERPDRVDIIRYEPEPIHILQFHYGPRRIDQSALHTTEGSDATTPADAKTWMQDELLVEPNEWQDI